MPASRRTMKMDTISKTEKLVGLWDKHMRNLSGSLVPTMEPAAC